ncbi:MAG: arginine--tRNA ligase [Candidatus Levybacteria bacterium RIFCSPHIGHO2_01_FULL_40_15b]|nr:MAG: arginine--tRNA ligase [Candidatus Levybacteria bacterium RIFCSPHIGHO2_01_FULL_40_15b]
MEARELITNNLLLVVRKLSKAGVDVRVSISERLENGDYFTNVALRLASILKRKPLDIAYEIKTEFEKLVSPSSQPSPIKGEGDQSSVIDRVEVAPPGFVNFFLSRQYLADTIDKIREKGSKFGNSDVLKNQKVMVEFTDPNPFKEFHIGHLYSNLVGESISRLFESQRATVWRVCYQGDVGLHVAKAIYGMRKLADQMPDDNAPLSVRAQFMGRAYTLGSRDYDSNENIKKEIDELNKKIYDQDSSIRELYKKGRVWSLEYFDSIYKRLGTNFKRFYFESEVGEEGARIVREFSKKKVFEKSEGAIIFPGKKYGLHNRVFINSQGIPTYEAKDLGLAPTKYKDFPYDQSIIITAHEQTEYFKVVLKALEQTNPELAKKTMHIPHGVVRLPGRKISSRAGEVITSEWLMDEAVSRILRAYPDMDGSIAQQVGLAAIKYALLKNTIGSDIEFNFDESISLTGASGPYLEYTYVRTESVLEKQQLTTNKGQLTNTENGLNPEELAVLRSLVHFPEVVMEAQKRLAPNLIAGYLFDLSQKFNLFYQKHKIAGNSLRLELTEAVGCVLKNGLALIGIETVRKM